MKSFGLPESPGIYLITCVPTGKIYVGSAVNLLKRWKDHRYHLNHRTHRNPKLQNAWNKYGGSDAFTFQVLELVLIPEMLTAREQAWFSKLKPFGKRGFNIAREAGSQLGFRHSPESLAKMSLSRKGKPSPRKGTTHTPESREKMRKSHLGQKPAFIPSWKGRTHTAESIEKCRQAMLGHEVSAATRAKISAAKTGQKKDPKIYDARRKTLIVTSPDGAEQVVTGIRAFCKEHNLDISSLMRVAEGECSQHKGWKARYPSDEFHRFMPHEVSSDERSTRASSQKKTLLVIDPDGVEYTVHGISQFARQHGLNRNHLIDVAEGRRHHHQGWKASYPQD